MAPIALLLLDAVSQSPNQAVVALRKQLGLSGLRGTFPQCTLYLVRSGPRSRVRRRMNLHCVLSSSES